MVKQRSKDTSRRQDSAALTRRRPVFYLVLVLLPVLLLLLLEAGLRLFDYGQSYPLFIAAGDKYPAYLTVNPDVGLRYFRREDAPPYPRNDLFLKHKPDNGFRIFMLGGSTAAGWPYRDNMMPSRIIATRLGEAFPDRHIEVVNVAFSAINTYTLLDFVDEILAQAPDAVLIYSGHNEFYGVLGVGSSKSVGDQRWLVRAYLEFQHYKVFRLLQDLIHWLTPQASLQLRLAQGTLMERMVAEKTIPLEGAVYQRGVEQFQANLDEILRRFRQADVDVIISELVSNVQDQAPFVSVATQAYEPAREVYQAARQLEQQGEYPAAREMYYRAKDLDALRFRAPEQFNRIIHRLAADYEVPVVPMQTYFEGDSSHGLIGANLMLEHLHPNIDGYFLMSEAFLDAMRRAGWIRRDWPETLAGRSYRAQWGVTALDRALARISVMKLTDHWPFTSVAAAGENLERYRPESRIETLALEVYNGERDLIQAHLALAREYQEQGDIDAAAAEYQAIIELFPFDQSVYRAAAWALLKADRIDAARPIILRSLRVEPTAESYKWLGQIAFRHAEYPQAVAYFEQALELYTTDNPQVIDLLAQAYEHTGQTDKARRMRARLGHP